MGKAQGGSNDAVLVARITGLIILNLLLLPEGERRNILENETEKKSDNGINGDDGGEALLRAFPVRLDTVGGIADKRIPISTNVNPPKAIFFDDRYSTPNNIVIAKLPHDNKNDIYIVSEKGGVYNQISKDFPISIFYPFS